MSKIILNPDQEKLLELLINDICRTNEISKETHIVQAIISVKALNVGMENIDSLLFESSRKYTQISSSGSGLPCSACGGTGKM